MAPLRLMGACPLQSRRLERWHLGNRDLERGVAALAGRDTHVEACSAAIARRRSVPARRAQVLLAGLEGGGGGRPNCVALGHVLHRLGKQELESARHLGRAAEPARRPPAHVGCRHEDGRARRRRRHRRDGKVRVSSGSRARLASDSVSWRPGGHNAIVGAPPASAPPPRVGERRQRHARRALAIRAKPPPCRARVRDFHQYATADATGRLGADARARTVSGP